jgi:GntR family transcriptional regulator
MGHRTFVVSLSKEGPTGIVEFIHSHLYQYCGTVHFMIFRLNPSSGQPLYLQLMEQVRHAVEIGTLQDGDQMPGIRTLAEELVVSHNTVAKAYTELQHAGFLELRHGSGAYISASKREKTRKTELLQAARKVRHVVELLHDDGFNADEIRRLFESQLLEVEHTGREA